MGCAMRSAAVWSWLVAAVCGFVFSAPSPAADAPDFNRDIRPILADRCFSCHGQGSKEADTVLRLDLRDFAIKADKKGHAAIVPGKPDLSELVKRIRATDPEERMPPDRSKKSLSDKEKDLLTRWIAAGAEYQPHWAFIPPKRPATPDVDDQDWVRADLDYFILARLEKEKLRPAPEVDRMTLLRRLTLDLTGLPPTVAEVDAFVRDTNLGAYDKVVERLLASPGYGERWGRLWLDAARYADSDGFEKDKPRFVWMYRDWVVKALQDDLPYDQFLVQQIAGDLLPNATQDQIVATGFLRNSMINEEGGVDPEQFRMEAMYDRMDAIGKGMLGLTIQCAQCHDHKFDPLTHEEYYRLFAFLNNSAEGSVAAYAPDELKQRGDIVRQIAELEADLQHRTPDWREQMEKWEAQHAKPAAEWSVVRPEEDTSGGQKHYVLQDGSVLAQGYAPTKHETKFPGKSELTTITAVRLELLNDSNLPRNGPGRSIFGLCAVTEFKVDAGPGDGSSATAELKIASGAADVNPSEVELDPIFGDNTKRRRVTGPLAYALDRKDETAWGIDIGPGRSNVPRTAVFILEKPLQFASGAKIIFRVGQNHGGWNSDDNQNNNLGRFRFSVTSNPTPALDPVPPRLREIFAIAREKRSPAQVAAIFSHWRTNIAAWKEANDKIESLWKKHPAGTSQLTMTEKESPRTTSLLHRGDFLKPVRAVTAGTPSFLHSLPAGAAADRLAFAKWLADRRSPTTARSMVNRIWQTYFGTGLVASSEDFGLQGDPPSHPELLDWLSVELMDNGWSLKNLHRKIVRSATYRQSSQVSAELLARDPENRLLARGPRLRVEAESVRDIALAASGLLNPKVGGPSVQPAAPAFLFVPPASYGPKTWKEVTGADRYRRALYTFRFRSVPYPALQNFDAPNGDFACVRRVRSNTPLQALTLLNEPIFMEAARALAMKTMQEGGASEKDRLTFAFRRCVSRPPSEWEMKTLLALYEKQVARFSAPDAKPWELAANDPQSPPALPEKATAAQLAAWTAVSRVLLNLDETITKE